MESYPYFAPIKRTSNGSSLDQNKNTLIDMKPLWDEDKPNGKELQKCVMYSSQTGKFDDIQCSEQKCFVCRWIGEPLFKLKGLSECVDSQIDQSYVLLPTKTFHEHLVFYGLMKSNIIFNKTMESWLIVQDRLDDILEAELKNKTLNPKIVGYFKPERFSNQLPIGNHKWELTDDGCRKNKSLLLTHVSFTFLFS